MKKCLYLLLIYVCVSTSLIGQGDERSFFLEVKLRVANTFYWGDGTDMFFNNANVIAIRKANAQIGISSQINACYYIKKKYALGLVLEVNQYRFQQDLITNQSGVYSYSAYWIGFGALHRYLFYKNDNSALSFTISFSLDYSDHFEYGKNNGIQTGYISSVAISGEIALSYRYTSKYRFTSIVGLYLRSAIMDYGFGKGGFWPYAWGLSVGFQI